MLSANLHRTALVVAHPDDEILWFSSIVDRVAKTVICFLKSPVQTNWTEGRQRVAKAYPLDNVSFLGLTESRALLGADWLKWPVTTEFGLELKPNPKTFPGFDPQRYVSNFERLVGLLRESLSGVTTVVTHNPWGEYGHEEHVQVHRAVASLQPELGFDLWYSNYCSDRSYRLMLREDSGFRSDYETLPTNPALAKQIEELYRREGCWTWPYDDYVYFPCESFVKSDPTRRGKRYAASAYPLNFIRLELLPTPPEPPVSLARDVARLVKRRLIKSQAGANH